MNQDPTQNIAVPPVSDVVAMARKHLPGPLEAGWRGTYIRPPSALLTGLRALPVVPAWDSRDK